MHDGSLLFRARVCIIGFRYALILFCWGWGRNGALERQQKTHCYPRQGVCLPCRTNRAKGIGEGPAGAARRDDGT
ncbi:uncharacterized protein P884DRAFT_260275 [Thermothelomyces heterothallicus CBS 202.75]|uniref:uncharacterized protein n=1 Tax=Thermothelomyces heterothallicus CBS 202.75 TaxID=1149848 RepID=UPI00374372D2